MHRLKWTLAAALVAAATLVSCSKSTPAEDLADYINPLIGTSRTNDGGLAPFVGVPHAMTKFTPQTCENFIGSMSYHYDDTTLIGILATHQPPVEWMGDYGYVSVMPQISEEPAPLPKERALKMDKENENSKAYIYTVEVSDSLGNKIGIRTSSASRAGLCEFTYPEKGKTRIIVQGINLNPEFDNFCNNVKERIETIKGWVKVDQKNNEIIGYNPDRMSSRWGPELPNFKGWFIIQFDQPITSFGCYDNGTVSPGAEEIYGIKSGAWVDFADGTKTVRARITTSFISLDQARENLSKEVKTWDLDKLAAQVKNSWNEKLNKLTVEGASEDDKHVFYTAIYHAYLVPRDMDEYGHYYSAYDDQVHEGKTSNDFATWDTFRSLHPLMCMLEPEKTGEWCQALVQDYEQGGWLPKWPNPAYTNVMIGTHADAIISDAYMKGIRNFDIEKAYEAMMKDATVPPDDDTLLDFHDREITRIYEARSGLTNYRKIGYVAHPNTAESVSRTVEFGIDDWAIAQVAKDLGKDDDYNMLIAQSKNYKNLYYPEHHFLSARRTDGSWVVTDTVDYYHAFWDPTFAPGYTEADAFGYTFGAMHDVEGTIEMMGKEWFLRRLNQTYREKHYYHANEPGHHYDYLYDYVGMPWRTQELVREDIRSDYSNTPEGMMGNDDCGQMSAWYLLSCMGIYNMAPGSTVLPIGAPQFPKINLEVNGHRLSIIADNLSEENLYVKEMTVDGKPHDLPFIDYKDFISANEIRFAMTNEPQK